MPGASEVARLLKLPCADQPLASIVIPVFNKLNYTLVCLAAVASCEDRSSYEVIVVDDGSTDGTAERVSAIEGVRYVCNPRNEGFIASCNRGASIAKGQFLVFLNNDTAVQPGWLDSLLGTFRTHTDAGLVGAKLLYPNGMLQEAGGILYSDGRAGNYGRFDAAKDPRYTYVRDVDYCSGAALVIRKMLFEQLGRFDDRYRPAYYEDADLAMRVREAGLRVLYQPRSLVVHFEGITSGTSEAAGTKSYQVRNREIFQRRWQHVLERDHPAWGKPLDLAVAKAPRTLVMFCNIDEAITAKRQIEVWQNSGRLLSVWIEHGELPADCHQRWAEQGVEVWCGHWRTGLRGWLKRHGMRFSSAIIMSSAGMRRYGRLFEKICGKVPLHADLSHE